MRHAPATLLLPWHVKERGNTLHTFAVRDAKGHNICLTENGDHAAYIAHAAKVYPRLVADAQAWQAEIVTLIARLPAHIARNLQARFDVSRALLREIGEEA